MTALPGCRVLGAAAAAAMLFAGCGRAAVAPAATSSASSARSLVPASFSVTTAVPVTPVPATPTPAPLVPGVADYHGIAEAAVAMRLQVPARAIDAPVFAVGLTMGGAMDAPEGPPDSPVWQQAFWYRGGVEPGRKGTATLAGHVDDSLARPGAFANLPSVRAGDAVSIVDQRSGAVIRFRVVETDVYDLKQLATIEVLTRLFGADAVASRPPGTTPDTEARLTLITCAGTWVGGGFDHRFVAYAIRADQ